MISMGSPWDRATRPTAAPESDTLKASQGRAIMFICMAAMEKREPNQSRRKEGTSRAVIRRRKPDDAIGGEGGLAWGRAGGPVGWTGQLVAGFLRPFLGQNATSPAIDAWAILGWSRAGTQTAALPPFKAAALLFHVHVVAASGA